MLSSLLKDPFKFVLLKLPNQIPSLENEAKSYWNNVEFGVELHVLRIPC